MYWPSLEVADENNGAFSSPIVVMEFEAADAKELSIEFKAVILNV